MVKYINRLDHALFLWSTLEKSLQKTLMIEDLRQTSGYDTY